MRAPRRRGEPLLVLGAVALGWITVRAFAWQSPFPPPPEAAPGTARPPSSLAAQAPAPPPPARVQATDEIPHPRMGRSAVGWQTVPLFSPIPGPIRPAAAGPSLAPPPPATITLAFPPPSPSPSAGRRSAEGDEGGTSSAPLRTVQRPWRVDGWFAWRPSERPSQAVGPLAAAYGGSQAGAVARLDLGASRLKPQVYLRALYAPDGPRQSDVAVGISARPVAAIPVRLQAEARATHAQGATFVRPAALAVSELAPLELPLGVRGEGYAQAGWVGGRFATGFVDGQVRLDRELLAAGPARLRLGAGAWGGAQKGAARLDVGPSLTLDLRDASVPARVSLDYRYQVAGDAVPGSGVAVTLSTGF